ncbi:NUDIX hydrolase domain-like protein [Ochromonadaceae sp. CCMP2298]|nr:NUDIX hydrolase domain-like protein [Ochromonadaceae sp. CCMP2298]
MKFSLLALALPRSRALCLRGPCSVPRIRTHARLLRPSFPSASPFSTSSSQLFSILLQEEVEQVSGVLQYKGDKYDGVIIDQACLPSNTEDFLSTLETSLQYWRQTRRRGVWLKVPVEMVQLVEPAVRAGFSLHHAEKEYIMLNCWLSTDDNRMPPSASHQVGVGSVVLHPQHDKILLVQERSGPLKNTGTWKLPTGLCDHGEDIADAAVREVFEETGVRYVTCD